jgi:hypothetical protein
VTGLSNVLRESESVLSGQELADWEKDALQGLLQGCHDILLKVGQVVDENSSLKSTTPDQSIRDKSRRAWKRMNWDPKDIQDLRSRITLNIGFLSAFNGSLNRCVSYIARYESSLIPVD